MPTGLCRWHQAGTGVEGKTGERVIQQAFVRGLTAIIHLHQIASTLECDISVSMPLLFQRKPDIHILKEISPFLNDSKLVQVYLTILCKSTKCIGAAART